MLKLRSVLSRLWADERGAILSIEFLTLASVLVLGLVVGLTSLRNAITVEFQELSNALLALSQGYSVGGLTGCCAFVQGSQAIDVPGLTFPAVCTQPVPSFINVFPCP
jgi:Flp pilus assembly pilin Flp